MNIDDRPKQRLSDFKWLATLLSVSREANTATTVYRSIILILQRRTKPYRSNYMRISPCSTNPTGLLSI